MRDAEIAARANAYAEGVVTELLAELPATERVGVKLMHGDKVKKARTLLARAFVIGFAAGCEDSALPRRRR